MTIEFQKGDKVYSDTFGEGEVVEFKNRDVMRVRFFGALRDEEFSKYGRFRNGLPVSLKLVERAKPEWLPMKGDLVLVRDNDESHWAPFYFNIYRQGEKYPYRVGDDEFVGFKQCKPHPTHLNWIPWSKGDPIPECRALFKFSCGDITAGWVSLPGVYPMAYCLLDEQP